MLKLPDHLYFVFTGLISFVFSATFTYASSQKVTGQNPYFAENSGSSEVLKECKNKKVVGKRVRCMDVFEAEQDQKAEVNKILNSQKSMESCKNKKVVGKRVRCLDKPDKPEKMETTSKD